MRIRRVAWRVTGLLVLWLGIWCQGAGLARHLTMSAAVELALLQRTDLKPTAPSSPSPSPSSSASAAPRVEHLPPPSLSFTALETHFQTLLSTPLATRPPGQSLLPGSAVFDENVYVGMPVYNGVRLGQRPDTERTAELVVVLARKAQVEDIVRATRRQFLAAILARDEAEVYQDIVDKDTEAGQLAQTQFEAGKVPQAVAFRARLALISAQQRLNNAKAEAAEAVMDLKLAIGIDQVNDVVLDGDFGDHAAAVGDLPTLLSAAMKDRPDLQGALLLLPPNLRPKIELLRQFVRRDVYRANQDVQTQLDNLNLTAPALEAAQENFRIAHLRFETGRGVQLELLDAVDALEQVRLNRLRAAYAYQTALAELSWATGAPLDR